MSQYKKGQYGMSERAQLQRKKTPGTCKSTEKLSRAGNKEKRNGRKELFTWDKVKGQGSELHKTLAPLRRTGVIWKGKVMRERTVWA